MTPPDRAWIAPGERLYLDFAEWACYETPCLLTAKTLWRILRTEMSINVEVLSLVSLLLGIIGGVIGIAAVWMTWILYRAGLEDHRSTLQLLGRIEGSSHTTEVTSTHFTERLVSALVELLGRDVRGSLNNAQVTAIQRVDSALTGLLRSIEPDLAARVREKVRGELSEVFGTVKLEAASVARLGELEAVATPVSTAGPRMLMPGVPSVLRWVASKEGKLPFLSVKFLREKVFGGDPVAQEALQFALDNGLLETYQQPNPKNPDWPTTACRLNRKHPVVEEVLRETPTKA